MIITTLTRDYKKSPSEVAAIYISNVQLGSNANELPEAMLENHRDIAQRLLAVDLAHANLPVIT